MCSHTLIFVSSQVRMFGLLAGHSQLCLGKGQIDLFGRLSSKGGPASFYAIAAIEQIAEKHILLKVKTKK